ncbi:hypothetical protein JTB14_015931 [Gonioctena quinquepunctata]|nr:hypothetical protein JTB14_015931 [Gonioctena quinquepunctata]
MSFLSKKPLDEKFRKITDAGLGAENALVEFNPGRCILPPFFENYASQILDAPVREDDVWLVSYPRTGSTWCQEMVWLIGNNLDFEKAQSTLQQLRSPLIEMSVVLYEYTDQFKNLFTNSVEYVNNLPSPRFIKSHLPYQLLPAEMQKVKPKMIYTMRNPKDLCVSYFYHCKLLHGFNVEFETFCELFLNDAVAYGGIFNHYLEFWNRRHETNMLILKYEGMKANPKETVRKIADFLEKPLTDEEVESVTEFLSFQKMRRNKACNAEVLLGAKKGEDYFEKSGVHFIRKGEVGDWKNHMSGGMSARFDRWINENTKGTDLHFDVGEEDCTAKNSKCRQQE